MRTGNQGKGFAFIIYLNFLLLAEQAEPRNKKVVERKNIINSCKGIMIISKAVYIKNLLYSLTANYLFLPVRAR